MTSTNRAEIEPLAAMVTELQLQVRRVDLRKREPRSRYVRDLRKKIAAYVARPVHMLLAIAIADLEDGASLTRVLQPFYACIALLREHAARRDVARGKGWDRRYQELQARECDAESKLDKAQLRVAASPHDQLAIRSMQIAIREYRSTLDEMEALLNERTQQLAA